MNTKRDIGQVITSYLEREHYQNLTSTDLAKIIFAENPIFDSVEHARQMIRYYKGQHGRKDRKKLQDRRFVRDEVILSKFNDFDIPESDAIEYEPVYLPKVNNDILILPDLHIPYHDVNALNAVLKWAEERTINTIILLGDFWDCYKLSYFATLPDRQDLGYERGVGNRILDIIQGKFPKAKVYYVEGNHEERWKRVMIDHPRLRESIFGMNELQFDILMGLAQRDITWIGDKRKLFAGKLAILHGHEPRGGSASLVNPARWLFTKTLGNAICGHFHRTSDHSEPNVEEELKGTWSVGCLCELHPFYMPMNKWNHGFARIKVNEDGTFKVFNPRIYNGQIL